MEKKWIQADKEYVETMCYKTTFRAAMPGKLRGAPTRQEGEKLLAGRWWWHGADAADSLQPSCAAQH